MPNLCASRLAPFERRRMDMKRKILTQICVFVCVVYLSTSALASSPYMIPSSFGNSPFQTPSGYNSGTMPGNGNNQRIIPGSGVSFPGSNFTTPAPGSGTGIPYAPANTYESDYILGSGADGSSGDSGNHFGVSFGSDGSMSISLPNATGVDGGDATSAISLIFQKYKSIGVVIVGMCIITAILSVLVQITKLGAAGDNERMRVVAMKGIIISGGVLSAFGALALVMGFFWKALA